MIWEHVLETNGSWQLETRWASVREPLGQAHGLMGQPIDLSGLPHTTVGEGDR
jgi:hypothetical protein